MFSALGVLLAAATVATAAEDAPQGVRYAPAPEWVVPPPESAAATIPPGAPVRVVYRDTQVRITDRGQEEYQASRIRLLTPEGLAAGHVALSWSPASDEMVVHRLAIIREGQTIDVLAAQKFAIIQRENNLEQSMLSGDLTATLQAAGLQVGDEVEFAATKLHRETSFDGRPHGFMQLPVVGMRGVYRLRIVEPKNQAITYRASADLPEPVVRDLGQSIEHQYLLTDPASATIPERAPPRYTVARLAQFSGYGDWAAVSQSFAPLYTRAATLKTGSPIKAEAARLAAGTTSEARRAEAALQLVQDRIRYVYVGLDGGNYRPAGAEETWERRFGDCKAKAALLIALLREMGIAAEPVLVASMGGDGIDQRLPTPAVFDHIVVRATIDGKSVWLDGTRTGDRSLELLSPPRSRWALPLRTAGARLEPIAQLRPRLPNKVEVVEIDASAGFDKPGKYRVQQTLRGDEIFLIRAELAGVAPADADKMLASYWRQQLPDVEAARTTWRFDDANRLLVLGLEGEGKVDWDGDALEGRTHYLFGGGFPPPDEMKRPKDQPQDAAYANDYPAFTCYATTIKVPATAQGMRWSFSSKPMDRELGGVAYWRISSFDGKVARMVKSRRVDRPEISAVEAAALNAAIPGFDNNKSYLTEVYARTKDAPYAKSNDRFGTFEDFAGAAPPCQSERTPVLAGK